MPCYIQELSTNLNFLLEKRARILSTRRLDYTQIQDLSIPDIFLKFGDGLANVELYIRVAQSFKNQ